MEGKKLNTCPLKLKSNHSTLQYCLMKAFMSLVLFLQVLIDECLDSILSRALIERWSAWEKKISYTMQIAYYAT